MLPNHKSLFKVPSQGAFSLFILNSLVIILVIQNLSHFCEVTAARTTTTPHPATGDLTGKHDIPEHFNRDRVDTSNRVVHNDSVPPVTLEANVTHTATLIFLHDYGQTGSWWAREMNIIRQPYMKVLIPNANMNPVWWHSKKLMHSWFDFGGTKYPKLKQDEPEQLDQATAYVHKLINEEIKNGIKPERIILGGISQGSTLAIHSAISYPKKLGGIFAMSSWEPCDKTFNENFIKNANKDIPYFQGHCDGDPFSSFLDANCTANKMMRLVTKLVDYRIYNSEYQTTEEEYMDINAFCKKNVGPI